MSTFVHESAKIIDSEIEEIKLYRNTVINSCKFGNGVSIGDDTVVERCVFENNVTINRRSYINDSFIGKYTYTGINTTINWAKIGRFCSIARNVDIGGFNHDYHKITTMPEFRWSQICNGGGKLEKTPVAEEHCIIGNDVWIAAGAQVLHKVKIGNGAVVGAGAIVTKDVPPYAIVAGVPARVIGYRCSQKQIEDLECLKWWDWPQDVLHNVMEDLIKSDINDDTIFRLKKYKENIEV